MSFLGSESGTRELIEKPFMLVAIVLAACNVVRCFALSQRAVIRLKVGFVALALSVATELILTAVLQGRCVEAYVASRDPVSGSVYLATLTILALMPLILDYCVSAHRPHN